MCSSNSAGKITKDSISRVLLWPTLFLVYSSPQMCGLLNVVQSTEGWLLARAPCCRLCPHYIGRGFCLPATQKGDSHICQCNKEKKGNRYLRVKYGVEILFRWWVIKFCVVFRPSPFLRVPNPHLDSGSASWNRILSTCKLRGFSTQWGGGWLG